MTFYFAIFHVLQWGTKENRFNHEREKKNSSLNLFANVIFFYLVISSSSSGVLASRCVFFPLVWITVISAPNWSDQQNQHNPLNLFGFEFKTKCTRMRVHDFHTRNPETLRRTWYFTNSKSWLITLCQIIQHRPIVEGEKTRRGKQQWNATKTNGIQLKPI